MIPRRFELYRPPLRSVYDASAGAYPPGVPGYATYNYLRGGPVAHIKAAHFEVALREARPWFGSTPVIDFGCADGVMVPSLAHHFGEVLAIDHQQEFVDITQRVIDEAGLANASVLCNSGITMEELAERLRPRAYRVAFLLETLEHIADPRDLWASRVTFVEQVLDLLRDDGIVIASVPTMVGPAFAVQRAALAAFGLEREPLSTRELLGAVLGRTDALEARWKAWGHLGFNHRKLERALAQRLRIVAHRNLFFTQVYVLARR